MRNLLRWYYILPAALVILLGRAILEEKLTARSTAPKAVAEEQDRIQLDVEVGVKVESKPTPAPEPERPKSQYPDVNEVRAELAEAERKAKEMTKVQEAEFVASINAHYLNMVVEGEVEVVEVEPKRDGWYRIMLKADGGGFMGDHLWAYIEDRDTALRLERGETIRIRGRIYDLGMWFTPSLDQVVVLE
jgi:hypothetical protein